MTKSTSSSSRSLRAFTLTETAIVLGIVGIVVAAIWGAASAADRNKKLNQTVTNLSMIVQNMHTLYRSTNQFNTSTTDLTVYFIRMGVFPSEMVKSDGNGVLSAWGTPTSLTLDTQRSFAINIGTTLKSEDCIGLVARLSGAKKPKSLIRIVTNVDVWNSPAAITAITPSTIRACNNVHLIYDLNG